MQEQENTGPARHRMWWIMLAQTNQAYLGFYQGTLRSLWIGSLQGFPQFDAIIYDIKLLWGNDNGNPDDQRSQTEPLQLKYAPASVSRQSKMRGSAMKRLFSTKMLIYRQLYNNIFPQWLCSSAETRQGCRCLWVAFQSHWLQNRRHGARQPPMLMSTFFMLSAVSSWKAIHHVETARSRESFFVEKYWSQIVDVKSQSLVQLSVLWIWLRHIVPVHKLISSRAHFSKCVI